MFSTIFCAVWTAGVFYTQNGGATWSPLVDQAGLTNKNVHCMAVDGERNTLYLGTEAGVQTLINYPIVATETEGAPVLQQMLAVWPSPLCSGPLHVRYVLARPSDRVLLAIFNVAGQRVRTLESASGEAAGPHGLTWDARDGQGLPVAAGLYFLRLESGEGTRTARVVVPAQ